VVGRGALRLACRDRAIVEILETIKPCQCANYLVTSRYNFIQIRTALYRAACCIDSTDVEPFSREPAVFFAPGYVCAPVYAGEDSAALFTRSSNA
jgi:hypothetical protein